MSIALLELQGFHCREVVRVEHPALYCGHRRQAGSSYCPAHHAKNWITTRRQDTRPPAVPLPARVREFA